MSADGNGSLQNGFKLVKYKRKSRTPHQLSNLSTLSPAVDHHQQLQFDFDKCLSRVNEARIEIRSANLFESAFASLREALALLNTYGDNPVHIDEIVCFGLGHVSDCMISRFQFAFLLCLQDLYGGGNEEHCRNNLCDVIVYDPVFTANDKAVIEHYQCRVLSTNCEGKYNRSNNNIVDGESTSATTLFYLPHCPKRLINNLLWSNWGGNLLRCVLISNSFTTIVDNVSRFRLEKSSELIRAIYPYTVELPIYNDFKYFEIFNDTAIHLFPWDKIKLLTDDFWQIPEPNNYSDSEDIEFIPNKPTN